MKDMAALARERIAKMLGRPQEQDNESPLDKDSDDESQDKHR